jgi:hypothetical protein
MSFFEEVQKKNEKNSAHKGLEWPLDQWYIERALFALYGGITTLCILLAFLFGSQMFLVLAMLGGILQILFAVLGIDVFSKIFSSAGLKEKQKL